MNRYWIEYARDWRLLPMAYWVHIEQDGLPWPTAQRFAPPAPGAVGDKGFAVLCVAIGHEVLRFSSRAQAEEFLRVMAMKPVPTSTRLARLRGPRRGPNTHWLSRLPAALKSPKLRDKTVRAVADALTGSGF